MKIENVTSYGSGVIGAGWATNFLMEELNVTLFDIDAMALENSKKLVEENLMFLCEEGVLTADEVKHRMRHLVCTTDAVAAVENADFIQENCPERLALKQSVLAEIEKNCRPDAIIASSTSGLLISDIAANADHPERIVGGHPYSPVHLVPLVEMSKWEKTDPGVIETASAFYKQIKKEPIVLNKEAPGFICNRIQAAVLREAADLVNRDVCSMDDVERAVCYGPGLRYALVGPHTQYNMAGGAGGIGGLLRHIGKAAEAWFVDMAKWEAWPEDYLETVQEKMDKALTLRPAEQGRTTSEIARFRDKGLVQLLRYHGKM